MAGLYKLHAVHKSYDQVSVLIDVSCEIPTTGIVVIMGPSGSGKSTLLRQLGFVETPDQGEVTLKLDGNLYSSSSGKRPWPEITCVFQNLHLWPHLTIEENISLPLRSKGNANWRTRVDEAASRFGMTEFLKRYPNEVSGGQAQRAALARALVLEPRLVLIDEAHTGLDLRQQAILNEHFVYLRRRGVGLIIVSHSLEFSARYADQLILFGDAGFEEVGSASNLLKVASESLTGYRSEGCPSNSMRTPV